MKHLEMMHEVKMSLLSMESDIERLASMRDGVTVLDERDTDIVRMVFLYILGDLTVFKADNGIE